MIAQLVKFSQEFKELMVHHMVHENVSHRSPKAYDTFP